jgi:MFS family permease
MIGLLRARRFGPLFVAQGLGAVNDNMFKNALVVLALYRLVSVGPILVALAGGVFILPYALFSAAAGQLADKFDKSRVIRLTKWWELGLMGLAAAGFLSGSIGLLMLVLFGLGCQAAFFSPCKYGILPEHLAEAELVEGNGLIEAGTFLGILAGTVAGGVLIVAPDGAQIVSVAGLAVAGAGVAAAHFVPKAPARDGGLRVGWNIWRETGGLISAARSNKPVWLAILLISWFWAMGATVLAELPTVVQRNLGAGLAGGSLAGGGHVVTLFLTCFSVGIGIGSVACGALLKGAASVRLVPWMGAGISLFLFDFSYCAATAGQLAGGHAVLASAHGIRMLVDLLGLAVCGGVYSVPLYVICQEKAEASRRARVIAANNVMNAGAMVAAAVLSAGLFAACQSAPLILIVTATINMLVAGYIVVVLKKLHE